MEKINFVLSKKNFQKARFRKYLKEIKENDKLKRGFLIIIFFAFIVFLLDSLSSHQGFHYLLILVLAFLGLFFISVIIGNYSTWKDGEKDFDSTFNGVEKLLFAFNDNQFIYGSSLENKSYNWNSILNSFFIPNLNYIILENDNKSQFHLDLNSQQIAKIKKVLVSKEIPIHSI